MKKQIGIEIICFLLIVLFAYAALNKLSDVETFEAQIGKSPLLTQIAPYVAWGIPIIEICIALMLSVPRIKLIGLYASFALMMMFTAYIIAILSFSEHIPCSCGGVLDKLGWTEHLIFNIGFVILALIGILISSKKHKMQEPLVA